MFSFRGGSMLRDSEVVGEKVMLCGRPSRIAGREGSYLLFCSIANMPLFLTLDALIKFSIEDRLVGAGDSARSSGSLFSREGEAGSRPCQNRRGELPTKGEEPAGDASLVKRLPYHGKLGK